MTTAAEIEHLQNNGLYSSAQEHDACGVGFVAHIRGEKSHAIVQNALKILENLDHRGAVGADKLMGDGAGILIQKPDGFFRTEMAAQGVTLPPFGEYGVGMIFLPRNPESRRACEAAMLGVDPREASPVVGKEEKDIWTLRRRGGEGRGGEEQSTKESEDGSHGVSLGKDWRRVVRS